MKNVAVTFSVPKSINEWPVTKTLSNQPKGMETFLFNLRDETKIYNEQSSSKKSNTVRNSRVLTCCCCMPQCQQFKICQEFVKASLSLLLFILFNFPTYTSFANRICFPIHASSEDSISKHNSRLFFLAKSSQKKCIEECIKESVSCKCKNGIIMLPRCR